MRVIDTKQIYEYRRRVAKKKQLARRSFVFTALVLLLVTYSYIAYQRPLPEAFAKAVSVSTTSAVKPVIAWPSYGQAAFGTIEYGILDSYGDQKPIPTASVAKIMTALAVVRQKPLEKGKLGPTITLDDEDVGYYDYYASHDGSIVNVTSGEQLTQYQALQAMLLPSSNNMADSLVRWAFGSQEAYLIYANNLALSLGMTKTHIADASGFVPETVSTASDLVRLGIAVMQEPVIVEIVSQLEANIPVAGTVTSTNSQLGQNGIIGIKTGSTEEAGGCYLFAATRTYDSGRKVLAIGTIMAAPNLGNAMTDSVPMLKSIFDGFGSITVLKSGDKLGDYKFAWGVENQAVVKDDVSVFGWQGQAVSPKVTLEPLEAKTPKNSSTGSIFVATRIDQKSEAAIVKTNTQTPKSWWRITRQ